MSLRDAVQEMRELGVGGTLFRVRWEVATRVGLVEAKEPRTTGLGGEGALSRLPWAAPADVSATMEGLVSREARARLIRVADDAARGKILCFGTATADFGDPIDWYLNPSTGERWAADVPWRRSLADEARVGDVKLTWEAARFPHAYHFARAAAFEPARRDALGAALAAQVDAFVRAAPFPRGIHWFSAQEGVQRVLAWLFASAVLPRGAAILPAVAATAARTLSHVETLIEYSERAVYNNHLIAEALALAVLPIVFPGVARADERRRRGFEILTRESERQFDADGGYIAHSHNYERTSLSHLVVALAFRRHAGGDAPVPIVRALERALDFLFAHQNPADGRLPNFGANDGSMPYDLSTCSFGDFRPLLQTLSLVTRGERLYEPGPWDEMAAWLLGPAALEAPKRAALRRSVSFSRAGYHVLRGREGGNFATFRCGPVNDRFGQIDMLHLDVWWRGLNVAVDGGTYSYNGPAQWNAHFTGTGSHNTVSIDGRDQMLHYRRFKYLYWTRARRIFFDDDPATARVAGEHLGYARHDGSCVHRRSVLFAKDDLWVVVDRISGDGEHEARVHWLGGEFPFRRVDDRLVLTTPAGDFSIGVYDENGVRRACDVVAGQEAPPRGWLARSYGTKVAVPSLAVVARGRLPMTFVTVLGQDASPIVSAGTWTCGAARFEIVDGLIALVP